VKGGKMGQLYGREARRKKMKFRPRTAQGSRAEKRRRENERAGRDFVARVWSPVARGRA